MSGLDPFAALQQYAAPTGVFGRPFGDAATPVDAQATGAAQDEISTGMTDAMRSAASDMLSGWPTVASLDGNDGIDDLRTALNQYTREPEV